MTPEVLAIIMFLSTLVLLLFGFPVVIGFPIRVTIPITAPTRF